MECCVHLIDIVFDVINLYLIGSNLQQNTAAALSQWPSGQEDHQRDKHANGRVGIISRFPLGFPDDKGRCYDANVVDGITNYVDHNAKHSQVSARARWRDGYMSVLVVAAGCL